MRVCARGPRPRALKEHLVRLPTEAIRGNQRQSEAVRCNLVRLPTEGEGRLLLAGGFPCSEGAELRGRRAGHIREPAAKEVKAREGAPSPRARAAEQLTCGEMRGRRGEHLHAGSPIATGPCRGAADRGPPSRPSCWRAAESEGCPPAIRGHQRSSEVVRGQQRSSEVIRGHPRSSEVIRGHPRSSEVSRGHQRSSDVSRGHQTSAEVSRRQQRSADVSRGHQRSAEVIRGHQRSAEVIRGHQSSSASLPTLPASGGAGR
jgi:hypothetical protein